MTTSSEREKIYAKRIIELLDERDLAKKELEKLRERVGNAEDLKHRLEVAEAVNRSRGDMEQVMIEALGPFASRARGSNYVPGDAHVTVFMKDCRAALDAITPVVRGVKAESAKQIASHQERVNDALNEIEQKWGSVENYTLNADMKTGIWSAKLRIKGIPGELLANADTAEGALRSAATAAGHPRLQAGKSGSGFPEADWRAFLDQCRRDGLVLDSWGIKEEGVLWSVRATFKGVDHELTGTATSVKGALDEVRARAVSARMQERKYGVA